MKPEESLKKTGTSMTLRSDSSLSHRETIKEHLMSGGEGFELTPFQQELLIRWEFADEKIRQNLGKLNRNAIAELVKNKFNISLCTAKSDLVNAEYVFASSNPLNKAYRIGLRIEFLEREIRLASSDNDRTNVAKLEKVLAYYYDIYPEQIPVEVPKTLIFSFDVSKLADQLIPEAQVESVLDAQLQKNKLLDKMSTDIDVLDDESLDDYIGGEGNQDD
jgi:hypothetical protein